MESTEIISKQQSKKRNKHKAWSKIILLDQLKEGGAESVKYKLQLFQQKDYLHISIFSLSLTKLT